MTDRLYIIVRSDLPPGLQMAQACHAVAAWVERFGAAPENLVCLNAPDRRSVFDIFNRLGDHILPPARAVIFEEPDLDGEVTAVAVGVEARALVSQLPLALKLKAA